MLRRVLQHAPQLRPHRVIPGIIPHAGIPRNHPLADSVDIFPLDAAPNLRRITLDPRRTPRPRAVRTRREGRATRDRARLALGLATPRLRRCGRRRTAARRRGWLRAEDRVGEVDDVVDVPTEGWDAGRFAEECTRLAALAGDGAGDELEDRDGLAFLAAVGFALFDTYFGLIFLFAPYDWRWD